METSVTAASGKYKHGAIALLYSAKVAHDRRICAFQLVASHIHPAQARHRRRLLHAEAREELRNRARQAVVRDKENR